jgi:Dopey, N-terminal
VPAASLTKDKGFRRYAAGVDRALGLFDTTLQEWADYISFLSRLQKALHNQPGEITVVPSRFIVAKRLAQCLHPSLPSGVHQKALEVYKFIFGIIGVDGLAEDLGVYLPGIASTLTFGSISVRILFLSLIEEYVLQLPTCALRPALKALILALLPGLEEETSDEFERTLKILNRCKHAFVSAGLGEVFWQNLFLASITSSSRRQGILVYLSRYLPKLGKALPDLVLPAADEVAQSAEITAVTTPEPGLLLRCFATGLADEQTLVQRAFLDLLVTHLPLHASIFHRQVVAEDLRLLVSAAVGVVLRRDMSLNRRLWSWFLGPESTQQPKNENLPSLSEPPAGTDNQNGVQRDMPSYFHTYGVQALIQSLEAMVSQDSRAPSKVSRPFRIALSLMDRWEIGSPVVNAIFLPVIRSLLAYQQNATSREAFEEVFRSANVFFNGVESTLIWSQVLSLVLPAQKAKENILRDLHLATFVVEKFNVREEEMVVLHIPLVSLVVLETLSEAAEAESGTSAFADREVQSAMYHLLSDMVDMISDRAFTQRCSAVSTFKSSFPKDNEARGIQDKVISFFDHNQDAMELSKSPFPPETLGKHFLQLLTPMILKYINSDAGGSDLTRCVQILSLLLEKLPSCDGLDGSALAGALKQRLIIKTSSTGDLPFTVVSSAIALFASFFIGDPQEEIIQPADVSAIVPLLVRQLWAYLSSSSPQHHIETVHLLEDLQSLFWQEELVTSTILSLVVGADVDLDQSYYPSKESLDRFATLWSHTSNNPKLAKRSTTEASQVVPSINDREKASVAAFSSMLKHSMISVLSVLRGPQTEVYATCRDWLQSFADLSRYG